MGRRRPKAFPRAQSSRHSLSGSMRCCTRRQRLARTSTRGFAKLANPLQSASPRTQQGRPAGPSAAFSGMPTVAFATVPRRGRAHHAQNPAPVRGYRSHVYSEHQSVVVGGKQVRRAPGAEAIAVVAGDLDLPARLPMRHPTPGKMTAPRHFRPRLVDGQTTLSNLARFTSGPCRQYICRS